jgi:hypothetical protein
MKSTNRSSEVDVATASRWLAQLPEGSRDDDVRWLVLERDPGSSGWFLFLCTTPTEVKWDDWRLTLREALERAEAYGVRREDWKPPLEDDVDAHA